MPPRIAIVRQMASLLAAQRTGPTTIQPIGEKWVYNFIKRHNNLQAKFNKKYDYQYTKYKDPILIQAWFKRVQDTKIEYKILDKDTQNFNKTGFQIGIIATI